MSHVQDCLGRSRKENVSRETIPSRMKRDNRDFSKLTSFVKNCINPFSTDDNGRLINISSGKVASRETTNFLLNAVVIGDRLRDDFINRCHRDPQAFEKTIPRQKLYTFASEGIKIKTVKSGKILEAKMEHDLMGRILVLGLERKIDMQVVLSFPLTPVLLCFSHTDESINKTDKSTLFKMLERRVPNHQPPAAVDYLIVDAFFLLHLLVDPPANYGKLSRCILQRLVGMHNSAKRIDLIFDRIVSPSIKDIERDRRCSGSDRDVHWNINGPEQLRPSDFIKALRNDDYKKNIVNFLIKSWADDSNATIIGGKLLYVTNGTSCFSYKVVDDKVICKEEKTLASKHEEADTKMIALLCSIDFPANVVIRTADTDVLVIAIGNLSKVKEGVRTFLEVGLQSNNSHRYIGVNAIYQNLGPQLSSAIAAYHAFTGCDYLPAFSRKGKIKPFSILEKSEEFQRAFSSLAMILN